MMRTTQTIHHPGGFGRAALATLALIAALGGVLCIARPAAAADTASLQGAYTDNYKPSYNGNPNVADLRTWLAFRSVTVGGIVYKPATLPATGYAYVGAVDGLSMKDAAGNSATLTAATTSTNIFGTQFFRVDPNGDFGLLIQHKSRAALQAAPIVETLTVRRNGGVVGSLTATYTYDPAVANVAPSSIEYNGPGGRWWVAGAPTRLNWEAAAPAPTPNPTPANAAPVLSGVSTPVVAGNRVIGVRITATDDLAVTQVRFANEDGVWSAWRTFSASTTWTLSSSRTASKGFSVQVRDGAGRESSSIYTRVTFRAAHDLDGDNLNDVIARRSDGTLLRYSGTGTGGFKAPANLLTGANAYDVLLVTPDVDGDGKADVLGRLAADGTLQLHPGTGTGGLAARRQVGSGWGTVTAIVAPGDLTGDAKADVLARKADGTLWVHPGRGDGTFASPQQVASGWGTVTAIVASGDLTGDAKADVLARKADGTLWLYQGNPVFGTGVQVGTGWGSMTALVGAGDLDDDGRADLLARRSDGTLALHRGTGTGTFGTAVQVATGWGSLSQLA